MKAQEAGHSPWVQLGAVAPTELTAARLQLHWAAQLVGQAGRLLVSAEPDDSHTNLLWSVPRQGFVGRELPSGHRVALEVARLRVTLVDAGGTEGTSLELPGRTLQDAFGWLGERLAEAGNDVGGGLQLPPYDLPSHPVADGAAFGPARERALAELGHWYADAAAALEAMRSERAGASEVRCWPHHFDIATLIALDPESPDPELARSVGVGLSPGDVGYPQPYFYITPWPVPEAPDAPSLPGGAHWHREGWFGAVLTGEQLVPTGNADQQRQRALEVIRAAIDASISLLQH